MTNNSPQPDLIQIAIALRQLVNIEAYKIIQGSEFKNNVEKILLLDRLGFVADEIAQIIGTTSGTVKKELSINKSKRVAS